MKKLYFILFLGAFLALLPVFSTSAEISANMDIQRYGAKNLTKNETIYSQDIKAAVGDELEFSVNVKNISANQANGVFLYVYLPVGFPLDSNSIYIDGNRTGGNISNGLFLGNLNANIQKDVIFKTKVNGYFNGYAAIQALVAGDNFSTSSKYAAVTRSGSANNTAVPSYTPSPTYTPAPTSTPTPTPISNQNNILGVSVLGKNLTKQDASWQKNVKAEPGDLLQFSIMLTANRGVNARNVYLKDSLDSFLDFVPGTVTINNSSASNTLISDRLLVGEVSTQEAKFVKFQARVQKAKQFGKETIILSNSVQAWADNNILISDSSSVSVAVQSTEEKKPAAIAPVSVKKNGGANNIASKGNLIVPKETPKNEPSISFLSGLIGFGSFWLLILLILIALVILLAVSLANEKKKNKNLAIGNQAN